MSNEALIKKLREINNPIVLLAVFVLIGSLFSFKELNLLLFLSFAFIIFLFAFFFKSKIKILIVLLSMIFGYFYPFFYSKIFERNLDNLVGKKVVFVGVIASEVDTNQFLKKYYLKINKLIIDEKVINLNTKVLVEGSRYEEYAPCDLVQLTGELKRPKGPLFPGMFNERFYLFTKGVRYKLKAEQGSLLFLGDGNNLLKKVFALRKYLFDLSSNYFSGEKLAFLNSLIWGAKVVKLSDSLNEKIKNLGLSHLVSASGFNVSILTYVVYLVLNRFIKNRVIIFLCSSVLVLLYSALAGFSASVIRAAILVVLVLIGNLFDKKVRVLPVIFFTVLLFFIISPVNILDIGFQLSILGFLSLALFSPESKAKETNWILNILNYIKSIFVQSLIAQLFVAPLIVFYFHNVQILGLISNLIAVPLTSIILIIGITQLFIFPFSQLALISNFIALITNTFLDFFLAWVNYLYSFNCKNIYVPNIDLLQLAFLYILLISIMLFVLLKEFRQKILYLFVPSVFVFFLFLLFTNDKNLLRILYLKSYNHDYCLILYQKSNPVLILNKENIDKNTSRYLSGFFRNNKINPNFIVLPLNGKSLVKLPDFLSLDQGTITAKQGALSFDFIRDYRKRINTSAAVVKLPIFMKQDPLFYNLFEAFPSNLIVNDYKKLSKKSKKNIEYLKNKYSKFLDKKIYFLSETGTILVESNGKTFMINSVE